MELKAYDYDVADDVFSALFTKGLDREDGLIEIPAASLQLVASALEYITWDASGQDREIIRKARGIVAGKQIALAKRIVMWASETRASTCIKAGRLDLLQYC